MCGDVKIIICARCRGVEALSLLMKTWADDDYESSYAGTFLFELEPRLPFNLIKCERRSVFNSSESSPHMLLIRFAEDSSCLPSRDDWQKERSRHVKRKLSFILFLFFLVSVFSSAAFNSCPGIIYSKTSCFSLRWCFDSSKLIHFFVCGKSICRRNKGEISASLFGESLLLPQSFNKAMLIRLWGAKTFREKYREDIQSIPHILLRKKLFLKFTLNSRTQIRPT